MRGTLEWLQVTCSVVVIEDISTYYNRVTQLTDRNTLLVNFDIHLSN